jgi:hypothetical protein
MTGWAADLRASLRDKSGRQGVWPDWPRMRASTVIALATIAAGSDRLEGMMRVLPA